MRPRLLPCNQPVVHAYLACATQWRHAANGLRIGMEYAGVQAALGLECPSATPARRRRLFDGIRVIEAALLQAQREWWRAQQGSAADG